MKAKRKLKIAVLASNVLRIPPTPPKKYVPPGWSGAPELIVHLLTEELVKRGHQVTLFASGDSKTSAKLISVTKKSTYLMGKKDIHEYYEYVLISLAYQMAQKREFDIIHSHFDIKTAPYAPLVKTPTLSTLHSPIEGKTKDILNFYKNTQYYASISNSQRKSLPDLQYAVTAYNGIDLSNIPYSEKKESYLILAGRISKEKGVKEAIQAAKISKHRLYLFGSNKQDDYWFKEIKPQIDGKQIIYHDIIPRSNLFKYIANAKAFIFPLQWEEPFGLTVVEALAAGTPVIAFPKGSLPEIITNNQTGFLVKSVKEMAQAINKISRIKPQVCRQWVNQNFTVQKMVDRYEEAYYKITKKY